MEYALVESAIRGSLIAAGVAVVLRVSRIEAPALLHAAWTGVVVAMLLLPAWTLWGPKASIHVLPGTASRFVVAPQSPVTAPSPRGGGQRVEPASTATTAAAAAPSAAESTSWNWRGLAMTIYGAVAILLLARLAVGTASAYWLRRRAVMRSGRLTSVACDSPVTVGWLRPVVILPVRWESWSAAHLDAVLAHEHAHVRRRDPFVQWLALLNRALFWFVPVTWWLERRLSALAEQSCDDAVLARGHHPLDYSDYLLEVARAAGVRARVNLAGLFMPGVHLPARIRRMLAGVPPARVSSTRAACVSAASLLAILAGAVAQPVGAQSPASPSRIVVRPQQPRWIAAESTMPQPVSLAWLDGDEWAFETQSISTSDELRDYSTLRTARERDAFIQQFWSRRDPTPETPDNEFRDEFERRVRFARENLADPDSAGTLAVDTDRGRVHLMFGAPDAIDAPAPGSPQEVWRYRSLPGFSSGLAVRFLPGRGSYCSYRVTTPAATTAVETVATGAAAAAPQASVQLYPHGLTAISMHLDGALVAGAEWDLRDSRGEQADHGQIGFLENDARSDSMAAHLPASWFDGGIGCTHALPPGSYTLTTAVRFTTGQVQRQAVTFPVP
jgi:GWxTD domain-containing protein